VYFACSVGDGFRLLIFSAASVAELCVLCG
jgi:hypothetical protein